ncbi:MAG: AAA family ATPase [Candidatus Acidiferrales bacterium]|jgi:general secretion pathway protein A
MYKKFFGLRENPFNVNPDPRYLFFTEAMEEAISALTYGIDTRKGFLLLTGEVGTGKTTLLNRLLDWLRGRNVATAFVFNSHLTVNQLFDFILNDFEIPCEERSESLRQIRLNEWLLDRYRDGQPAVLIVDEAQHLSFEVLEEIRMLTNLETATEKLLQIVLSGQPELEEKLKLPQLRQLRQRITIRTKTRPLTLAETRGYIAERLRIAGGDGRAIFPADTIAAIHKYAKGIPRVTNLLCEHAMINAYVDQHTEVSPSLIEEVATEFELQEIEPIVTPIAENGNGSEKDPLMDSLISELIERFRQTGKFARK